MRRLSILGATGSVGRNTVDLLRRDPQGVRVVALTGRLGVARLAADAVELGAEIAVTSEESLYGDLRDALAGSGVEAAAGAAALLEAASRPCDLTMSAILGVAGLAPGLAALEQGASLALANKESLVAAGPLMLAAAERGGGRVIPVDSEHSAIFQALVGEDASAIERIVLPASGGALRDWPLETLADASTQDAARHPTWEMGERITIDSASMFNKALEMIEARELFGVAPEAIEVVIHPESIVHALVGFRDGAMMAHVGPPDMRHAIGYALNWPERLPLPVERLDLAKVGRLSFAEPDPQRYPALGLAREAMARRGLWGAAFNGAKERALDHFVDGRLGFCQMAQAVEAVLDDATALDGAADAEMTLDAVMAADGAARERVDAFARRVGERESG